MLAATQPELHLILTGAQDPVQDPSTRIAINTNNITCWACHLGGNAALAVDLY